MTPKEKCNELFEMYYQRIFDNLGIYCVVTAKQCALICVDEIINCDTFFKTLEDTKEFTKYWYEVQTEIEKL